MHERRSKFEIIYEILCRTRTPTSKTKIVYGANLNFKIAEKYFSLLEELALLERVKVDGKTCYAITEKGKEFIRRYEDLAKDISKGAIAKYL
ncbi:winged helix-turn-helix domain-containing protein [Ferroglobus sp.]|uniref:winged helix-turn-helix domain-containing protein n=1 Tax=Ferroglobus sp. TaxID=2614230 RepID=UPI0025B91826|nr:winged helix-turn-helix domain-containing protein [Ferroglobus sp.]